MELNDDLINYLLPLFNIETIIRFRKTCKRIDRFLTFNLWVQKFNDENLQIMSLKLPNHSIEWIKEYYKMKNVIQEVKYLLTINTIQMIAEPKQWYFDKSKYPSKEELLTISPHYKMIPNGEPDYSFLIHDDVFSIGGYKVCDFSHYYQKIPSYDNKIEVFLTRLLYYHPNVLLTDFSNKSVRK
jgi:hypothetical protein